MLRIQDLNENLSHENRLSKPLQTALKSEFPMSTDTSRICHKSITVDLRLYLRWFRHNSTYEERFWATKMAEEQRRGKWVMSDPYTSSISVWILWLGIRQMGQPNWTLDWSFPMLRDVKGTENYRNWRLLQNKMIKSASKWMELELLILSDVIQSQNMEQSSYY